MYDHVYDAIVNEKVATPLDESDYYFVNRAGSRVKKEEEATGHQIKHRLSYPQHIMFRDELGTDTNKMDNGNNGGQR